MKHAHLTVMSMRKKLKITFLSFITKDKFPQAINTLVAIIKEIEQSIDENLGLSRLGSHKFSSIDCSISLIGRIREFSPIENLIGRIRSLCHLDNRFETVLHNVARYELIVRDFETTYLQFKPRHNSPGGIVLKHEGNELQCTFNP